MNLLALFACAASPPNLLVVVLDDVRFDHTSLGGGRDTTPNLALLAARGVTFDAAFAASPEAELDVLGLPKEPAASGNVRGYAFAEFGDADAGSSPSLFTTVPPAIAWMDKHHDVPWALMIHGGDARLPWSARGPFHHLYGAGGASPRTEQIVGSTILLGTLRGPDRSTSLTAPEVAHIADHYDSALTYGDLWLGVLLAEVDLERTVVVVVGSCGEDLLDHPEQRAVVADSTLHVPLVVAGPGFPPAAHRADAVMVLDVVPTLFALANPTAPPRTDMPGLSLLSVGPREITATSRGTGRWRRQTTGEWVPAP